MLQGHAARRMPAVWHRAQCIITHASVGAMCCWWRNTFYDSPVKKKLLQCSYDLDIKAHR